MKMGRGIWRTCSVPVSRDEDSMSSRCTMPTMSGKPPQLETTIQANVLQNGATEQSRGVQRSSMRPFTD